jgi:hypothetical protein
MINLIARTLVCSLAAAVLTAALALLAGSPAAARPLASADDWIGIWRGSYVCAQGVTGLFLTVKRLETGDVAAVFRFFAVPENPAVPSGEFDMAGTPGAETNHLDLYPRQWIVRPPNFVMVALDGDYDEATGNYAGEVHGPGCSRFILRRDVVS